MRAEDEAEPLEGWADDKVTREHTRALAAKRREKELREKERLVDSEET
jgi:hypothetical protein